MPSPDGSEITYRFGDFELLPHERMLTRGGSRVPLTPRALDLLLALVKSEGRLLSKETLLNTVWVDAAVEEGNLNRTISALRKALGETRNELKYIETVPKAGYRFVAVVEKRSSTKDFPDALHLQETGNSVESTPRPELSTGHTTRRGRRFALGAIAMIAIALLVSYVLVIYLTSRFTEGDAKFGVPADRTSIVRLTNNGFDEDSASWTSDDRIRFLRFSAMNKVESMIMNADGSDQRRAGVEIKDFLAGTWSPDGRRVLYSKEAASSRTPFAANADGTNEQKLPFNIGPFDWSPDGTKIVYSSNFPTESDSGEIVLYSFQTGELTNLTNHPAFDANPSFSPDGQQIIFNSDRDGNAEIYLMNVDGTGIRRLTNDPAKEAFQAFSPDGTQIVFNSNRDNEKVGVYLINVNDDSQPVKLSDTKYNAEIRPGCWSPDGTKIVFTSDRDGDKFNVYSMTVEPAKAKEIMTDSGDEVRAVAISQDGKYFALGVKVADGKGELRILDIASGRTTTLTSAENYDLMPNWSPDGKAIAFAMKSGGNTEIFTIKTDGTDLKNLTHDDARDGGPAWSPDGSKILFSSDRDGRSEAVHLFSMNTDGSDVARFTTRWGYEMTPAWSPDGKTIAYACDRRDGSSQVLDIFAADPADPGTERVLTKRRFHDTNPSFSPDGSRIAFVSQSDGNFEIYLINADGSGLVRVTRDAGDDMTPVFSNDGAKIYFVSNRSGKFGLYEMNVQ